MVIDKYLDIYCLYIYRTNVLPFDISKIMSGIKVSVNNIKKP